MSVLGFVPNPLSQYCRVCHQESWRPCLDMARRVDGDYALPYPIAIFHGCRIADAEIAWVEAHPELNPEGARYPYPK